MGIQINGQTDTISASDGGLVVSGQQLTGVTDISASGIITATQGYVVGTGASVFSPAANTLALLQSLATSSPQCFWRSSRRQGHEIWMTPNPNRHKQGRKQKWRW